MSVRYVVLEEHTLGYIYSEMPDWFCVLQGNVFKGGYSSMNGPVAIGGTNRKMRDATVEDFDSYRVCAKGHLI